MRLLALDPHWVAHEGRHGQAVSFQCPCCIGTPRETRLVVPFSNPLDGGPPAMDLNDGKLWLRTGDNFLVLSCTPSVDASNSGHWHGFITKGQVL
jgi:hypothetical protein